MSIGNECKEGVFVDSIAVYDNNRRCFRELDESNYDDDIVVGTVFFYRTAISVIRKYYRIVGYVLSDEKDFQPIDIRKNDIAMLEGTYNCLPEKLKKELVPFNIQVEPPFIWSEFFFRWQFMCDWNFHKRSGSFIELASIIIGDEVLLGKVYREEFDFVFPSDYKELSSMVRGLNKIMDIEFYNKEYIEDANYLFDSLINEYHVNMTPDEIVQYCYQLCDHAIKTIRGENV